MKQNKKNHDIHTSVAGIDFLRKILANSSDPISPSSLCIEDNTEVEIWSVPVDMSRHRLSMAVRDVLIVFSSISDLGIRSFRCTSSTGSLLRLFRRAPEIDDHALLSLESDIRRACSAGKVVVAVPPSRLAFDKKDQVDSESEKDQHHTKIGFRVCVQENGV